MQIYRERRLPGYASIPAATPRSRIHLPALPILPPTFIMHPASAKLRPVPARRFLERTLPPCTLVAKRTRRPRLAFIPGMKRGHLLLLLLLLLLHLIHEATYRIFKSSSPTLHVHPPALVSPTCPRVESPSPINCEGVHLGG